MIETTELIMSRPACKAATREVWNAVRSAFYNACGNIDADFWPEFDNGLVLLRWEIAAAGKTGQLLQGVQAVAYAAQPEFPMLLTSGAALAGAAAWVALRVYRELRRGWDMVPRLEDDDDE